jgi:cysteine peptidase B
MRVVVVALVLAAVCALGHADYATMFKNFKQQYNKQYPTAEAEAHRYAIFVQNMKKAAHFNKVNPLASFGVNEFADLSAEEFKTRHNSDKIYAKKKSMQKPVANLYKADQLVAGQAIDWRTKGAVTPVKNQGQCGSCWSFSTTGGIEGQWFMAGNPLTSLSEQELVSCDTIDSGCNGGLMDQAMEWLLQAHGGSIVTEASYPYVSGNGNVPTCSMQGTVVGATITNHQDLPHDETQMATWVYSNGPLSIAVDATSWQTYTGGIMTNCISSQIDHGVLIVGFDDTNSPPYWIIKNSWGASWGESGYIRVQKGTDQCLITDMPCTSIIGNGPNPPPGPRPQPPPPPPPNPGKKAQNRQ